MYSCVFWCEFINLVAFLALLCDPVTPSLARAVSLYFFNFDV